MKEKIESWAKVLPIAFPVLIFLGMAHLIWYYKAFNVQIIDFLNLSEVIISFFDILLRTIIFSGIIYYLLSLWDSSKKKALKNDPRTELNYEQTLIELKKVIKQVKIIILAVFIIIIIVYILVDLGNGKISIGSIILLSSLLFLIYLVCIKVLNSLSTSIEGNEKIKIIKSLLFFLGALILIGFIYINSFIEIQSVKYGGKYKGVEITLKDSPPLISDETDYYIGKTNDYVFYYFSEEKSTLAIRVEEINAIKY